MFLNIRLQPRASRSEVQVAASNEADQLRVRVTAPPVDNAANAALLKLISDFFDVSRGRLSIVAGQQSRNKTLRVDGIDCETMQTLLA